MKPAGHIAIPVQECRLRPAPSRNRSLRRVLDALPRSRYRRYDAKKLPIFKLLPASAAKIAADFIAEGELEAALRLNAEISFARGSLFSGLRWRERILLTGLIAAHQRDTERASDWLAAGFRLGGRRLLSRCKTSGFPDSFMTWLIDNESRLPTSDGWKKLFEAHSGTEGYGKLLVHISAVMIAMGLGKDIAALIGRFEGPDLSGWKKILLSRIAGDKAVGQEMLFTPDELHHGQSGDVEYKIMRNVVNRVFGPQEPEEDPLADDEARWMARHRPGSPVLGTYFPAICRALRLLVFSRPLEARDQLAPLVGTGPLALESLDARAGPTKLFVGGLGWTGSSAVLDALRGYPGVSEMPGVGTVDHINEGAESEPMLHQGPGGLLDLIRDCSRSPGTISMGAWKRFFRLYILTAAHENYFDYKTVCSNISLRERIGDESYYSLAAIFLYEYAGSLIAAETTEGGGPNQSAPAPAVRSIEAYFERLVKCLFEDDSEVVMFNNSINMENLSALGHVKGKRVYIGVNRNIADQITDQKLGNIFFGRSAPNFVLNKYEKLAKFRSARAEMESDPSIDLYYVEFERWVTDAEYRKNLAKSILNSYSEESENKFFNSRDSSKNIYIHKNHLFFGERVFLRLCSAIFKDL